MTYGTTLHALKDRGKLKAGETLAVLGASGGTGLAAVELGKLMRARVIACASSAEKIAFARKHGADDGIDYGSEDLKEALRGITQGRGADVIYDPVGGAYAEAALRSIAWQGRFLVVGFAAGEIPKLPLNLVLLKGCDVIGVFWGSWIERDPAGTSRQHGAIVGLVRGRKIIVARARSLSACGSTRRAQGNRGAASHGQGHFAAVNSAQSAEESSASLFRAAV